MAFLSQATYGPALYLSVCAALSIVVNGARSWAITGAAGPDQQGESMIRSNVDSEVVNLFFMRVMGNEVAMAANVE